MKHPPLRPIPSESLAEFVLAAGWLLLVYRPALSDPRSLPLALCLGLVLLFLRPPNGGVSQALGPWAAGAVLFSFLSVLWSLNPGLSLQSAAYPVLAVTIWATVRSLPSDVRDRLLRYVLAAAVASALLGMAQWMWEFDWITAHLKEFPAADYEALRGAAGIKRAFGLLVTPGAQAALLLLTIPFACHRALKSEGALRVVYGISASVLILGLLAAQSAGAWVALSVALVTGAFLGGGRRMRVAALIVAGVGAVLVLSRGWSHWSHASFGNRLLLWERAFHLGMDRWGWGAGAGCFETAYTQAGFPLATGAKYAHNLLLQVFAELGLPGLILAGAAFGSFLKRIGKGWASPVGLGVLGVFLYSLFDLPFVMPEILAATAIFSGGLEIKPAAGRWPLAVSISRQPPEPTADRLETPAVPFPSEKWQEAFFFLVIAVFGLIPPYRPANLCVAACVLTAWAAWRRASAGQIHPWIALTALYFVGRSLLGPSSLGSAWFLTALFLATVFFLIARSQKDPSGFLLRFSRVGLLWAAFEWAHFAKDPHLYSLGFFAQPKHLASFLAVLFLLEWTVAKNSRVRNVSMAVSAATLAAFRATGALAGLFAGLAVMVLSGSKRRHLRLILSVVTIALVGSLLWRFTGQHQSTPWGRIQMGKAAVSIWKQSPLLGAGPGSYGGLFFRYQEPQTGKSTRYLMDPQHAHNEWLEGLSSFGLAGLVLFVGLLFLAWRRVRPEGMKAALAASGVNAFFDFIWHTPVLAWQALGAGAVTVEGKDKTTHSSANALLALGLSLGVWGAAAFSPALLEKASKALEGKRYPEALRNCLMAERLSPWDYRKTFEKAGCLETLYRFTGDAAWSSRSDDAFEKLLDMERTEGTLALAKARRDAGRMDLEKSGAAFQRAEVSYGAARGALPFSSEVRREEGDFLRHWRQPDGARARYREALELEPNDASTWTALGDLEKAAGRKKDAIEAYRKALSIHERWKDQEVAPDERSMVTLPEDVLERLRRENLK